MIESIGGLVVNDRNEILVVKEKIKVLNYWKFPGGFVEQNEDLDEAIVREVREETGVESRFRSILAIRHMHQSSSFNCSDLYFVCHLEAINDRLDKCPHEIDVCEWRPIEDVQKNFSAFNKFVLDKFIESYRSEGNHQSIGFDRIKSIYPPPFPSEFNVYSIKRRINLK